MTRKRLGDLLREEAGEPLTPVSSPPPAPASRSRRRKPAASPAAQQNEIAAPAPAPAPSAHDLPVVDPATTIAQLETALAQSHRHEQELISQQQDLQQQLAACQARAQSLQSDLTEMRSQLQEQQTLVTQLQTEHHQIQALQSQLEEARQVILQLSAPPAIESPPPPKPLRAPEPTPQRPPIAVALMTARQEAIQAATRGTHTEELNAEASKTSPAKPYRFERLGWTPLSNHLIQPKPYEAKLSDADLGWVD
uniref:Uncharacterized protein n=1 Tax=Cyanothece sp. (strain PCC 7425 / ATCC 29141) TaxID=395961 RepID=B8HPS1_CYAP4